MANAVCTSWTTSGRVSRHQRLLRLPTASCLMLPLQTQALFLDCISLTFKTAEIALAAEYLRLSPARGRQAAT